MTTIVSNPLRSEGPIIPPFTYINTRTGEIDPFKKDSLGNTYIHNVINEYGPLFNAEPGIEQHGNIEYNLNHKIENLVITYKKYTGPNQFTRNGWNEPSRVYNPAPTRHAKPNSKRIVNQANNKGETPLMLACKHGMPMIINTLLFCGADATARSKLPGSSYKGSTALWYLYIYIISIEQFRDPPLPGRSALIGMNTENSTKFMIDAEIDRLTSYDQPITYPKYIDEGNLIKLYRLYQKLMSLGATAGGRRKTKRRSSSKMTRRRKYKKDC